MGAVFCTHTFKATDKREAKQAALREIDQAAWEHGHGGYSGSFAECRGVEVRDEEFKDDDAYAWLAENAEKWGPALVVKVLTPKMHWVMGGNCSS